jgi:uncharacterized lipoprotein YbaY/heat shock protein HslJ
MISLTVFIALLTFTRLGTFCTQQVPGDASWLDRAPANWNRRMAPLPRPDSSLNPNDARARCNEQIRQPEIDAERALVRAGWMLYGPVQSYGTTRVVTAMSGVDGMCRPLGYNAFVYWDGRYAGTLSASAMNSRTDGALKSYLLTGPARISAEFSRYTPSDPLCCPTRTTYVTYEINRDELPLVAVTDIRSNPSDTAAGGQGSGSAGSSERLFGRKWRLSEVNGVSVKSERPYIEFDRTSKRFSGHGGCNRIGGSFEIDRTNLRFLQVVSTRMACFDAELQQMENDFLKAMSQTFTFETEDNMLRLVNGGRTVLAFTDDSSPSRGPGEEGLVSGTVTYRQRIALSPTAVVEVKLVDVSRADGQAVTIAEQRIQPEGRQVPIAFELRYDPSRIQQRRRYVIQARILEDGSLRFISTDAYPVITGGNPSTVEVIVRPPRN